MTTKSPPESSEKDRAELRKLALEEQILERQLSKAGIALEWLKAGTVPAALVGVMASVVIGMGQLKQADEARAAERLDHALSRISSANDQDRITAISSLRLFLSEPNRTHQAWALHFLIDALGRESDRQAQSAILDALTSVETKRIPRPVLDEALSEALDDDRALVSKIHDEYQLRQTEEHKRTVAKLSHVSIDKFDTKLGESKLKLYEDDVRANRLSNYLFDYIPVERKLTLNGLASAITILIRDGAEADHFDHIYCERCDFSPARDLKNSNFDDSYLAMANFSNVKLDLSHFHRANLSGTNFFSASLVGVDFSSEVIGDVILPSPMVQVSNNIKQVTPPILDCADLRGANLSDLLLVTVTLSNDIALPNMPGPRRPNGSVIVQGPNLRRAIFDEHTRLERLGVIYVHNFIMPYVVMPAPEGTAEAPLLSTGHDVEPGPSFGKFGTPMSAGVLGPIIEENNGIQTRLDNSNQYILEDKRNLSTLPRILIGPLRAYFGDQQWTNFPNFSKFLAAMPNGSEEGLQIMQKDPGYSCHRKMDSAHPPNGVFFVKTIVLQGV